MTRVREGNWYLYGQEMSPTPARPCWALLSAGRPTGRSVWTSDPTAAVEGGRWRKPTEPPTTSHWHLLLSCLLAEYKDGAEFRQIKIK